MWLSQILWNDLSVYWRPLEDADDETHCNFLSGNHADIGAPWPKWSPRVTKTYLNVILSALQLSLSVSCFLNLFVHSPPSELDNEILLARSLEAFSVTTNVSSPPSDPNWSVYSFTNSVDFQALQSQLLSPHPPYFLAPPSAAPLSLIYCEIIFFWRCCWCLRLFCSVFLFVKNIFFVRQFCLFVNFSHC